MSAQIPVGAPPSEPFKLSMLWLDSRYRGITIQILALIGLLCLIGFLVRNTLNNLELLGLEFGYEILNSPSNYDINQTLVEYDSRSSHWRATLVGLINTGLVAVCGVIAATFIGFTAGVLRLSNNWLIEKLVYCWVEFTRNVPVLLQILLVHGIMIHSLPRPKQALTPMPGTFFSNRGFTMPAPHPEPGFMWVVVAFFIGIIGAFLFRRHARAVQEATGKILPTIWVALGLIIGLPFLVYLIMGSPLAWTVPELKGFNFTGGMTIRPEFLALWLALSLYTGAFISEIVRAGILSISKGQTEAAYAIGLKSNWTMRLVVLPQAMRVIIPPLISQYLNLTKNSSLAIAVGYMDIVATIGGISLNQTGRALECMSVVLGLYLTISLSISMIMNWYNKRVSLVER